MDIVWIGFHEEGILAFKYLLEQNVKIRALITLSDEKIAMRSASSKEYERICKDFNISVYKIDSVKSIETYNLIKELTPDLVVVLGWSEILPTNLLKIPSIGTVGTHAAMLPHNRGSAPVNWAIIKGEKKGGNTLMWLNKEVDAGNIIEQMAFPITIYDDCKTVYQKVAQTNLSMIEHLIRSLIEQEEISSFKPKDTGEALLTRRKPEDGCINWAQPAIKIYNFVRALTKPYPGAFSIINGKRCLIWKCSMISGIKVNIEPGTILENVYSTEEKNCGIAVAASTGIIIINEIEMDDFCLIKGRQLHLLNLKGTFRYEENIGSGSTSR